MKSVSSQNRLIITAVVGVAMLAALYFLLFVDKETENGHQDSVMDVHNAWVRATNVDNANADMTGIVSAAYMEIGNHGDTDRILVSASAPGVGMMQIHQTIIEDEVAQMMEQNGLIIPAGETVTLEPGGIHIMLMQLATSLVEGENLNLTLQFDDDSTLEIPAPVRSE